MSYGRLMADVWRENILYSVLVELTYQCNLDCFFCYNDLSLRGKAMRLDDYVRFFDDLEDMQVMSLTLSGGEPLAHPDFFEIGRAARERGFLVRIKSNGHALRDELARRLRDEVDPFIVEISLHGATAATHDRQTRVPGSFERLMTNLGALRDLGMRFKLNAALTRWNENEADAMFEIADSFDVVLQFDPTVTPRDDGDTEPLAIAATPEGLRSFVRAQARRQRGAGTLKLDKPSMDEDLPEKSDKHCGAGSLTIAVDPYGNVYPCVAWRTAVGNLRDSSIKDLWTESPGFATAREGTRSAKAMLEAEGRLGNYVSFCPGLAVSLTGRPDEIPADQRGRGATLMDEIDAMAVNQRSRSSEEKPAEESPTTAGPNARPGTV